MSITETTLKFKDGSFTSEVDKVTDTYLGCVVKVEERVLTLNHSDTLDYTDFRSTTCTMALCWEGRTWRGPYGGDKEETERPIEHRFTWHNCTSLFVDRGQPIRKAKVDVIALAIPELIEDLEVWLKLEEEKTQAAEAKRIAYEAAQKKARENEEKNRPVVGKQMVVIKGRKVAKGTQGTVAYIHASGSVLLKADNEWKDRNAAGRWIDPRNLAAR